MSFTDDYLKAKKKYTSGGAAEVESAAPDSAGVAVSFTKDYNTAKQQKQLETAQKAASDVAAAMKSGSASQKANVTAAVLNHQLENGNYSDSERAELKGHVSSLVEQSNKLKREEYYDTLKNAEDFADKSKYVSTANGKSMSFLDRMIHNYSDELSGWDDPLYEYINGNEEAGSFLQEQAASGFSSTNIIGKLYADAAYSKSESQQMKPDEVALFNYLYSTQGKDAAYAYYEYLHSDLNARQRETEEKKWADYAAEHPVTSSALSFVSSPLKGLSYFGQALDKIKDGEIDQNAGYNKFSYVNSTIRNKVVQQIEESGKWGKVGSFAYQTGMSMADFLLNTAITGGNSAVSLAIMGTGAAADATISAKDRGLSDGQAFTLGAVAGLAEVITEKVSLDTLLDPKLLADGSIKYVLKNMMAEGSEEVASDLINTVADILVAKDRSQWQKAIDAYIADGKTKSEAFGLAVADQAASMGLSFLGGAISGGIMSGGAAVTQSIYTNHIADALKQNGITAEELQTLIDTGLKSGADTESHQIAEKIQKKVNSGKTVTEKELSALLQADALAVQSKPGSRGNAAADEMGVRKKSGVGEAPAAPGKLNIEEILDEVAAKLHNRTATPLEDALEAYKTTGTVSNKQAEDILDSSIAVRRLVDEAGLKMPETQSQRRAAVKAAVAALAQPSVDTAEQTNYDNNTTEQGGQNHETNFRRVGNGGVQWRTQANTKGETAGSAANGSPYAGGSPQRGISGGTNQRGVYASDSGGGQHSEQSNNESGSAAGAFGVSGERYVEEANRSGIQRTVGEAGGEPQKNRSLGRRVSDGVEEFGESDYVTPKKGSRLRMVQSAFEGDGIECHVVKASAWTRKALAYSRNGRVYVSESIDEDTLATAVPHENTHIMKQRGFQPYLGFITRTPDMLNLQSDDALRLLGMVSDHRGMDTFGMSDSEFMDLYDELNATVYGMYIAGILSDKQFEYGEWIPGAFLDFDGYISEMDSIHEQYESYAKSQAGRVSASRGSAGIPKEFTQGIEYDPSGELKPSGYSENILLNEDGTPFVSVGANTLGSRPLERMIGEYGAIPEGENPVRADQLPKSTDGKNRVSYAARTSLEAAVTPDAFAALIGDVVTEGGLTYMPITNNATVEKATEYIRRVGWEAALTTWKADVMREKAGALRSAIGALLLNNAAHAGDETVWKDVLFHYQFLSTNTAQGMQALRILKQLTPDQKLYMVERSVDQMVADMHLGVDVTIDEGLKKEFQTATSNAERDAALDKIAANVAKQIPATFMDKLNALRYVNMLGNVRTQLRNIAGNMGMKAVASFKNAVAAGLEHIAYIASGGKFNRTKSLTVNRKLLEACKQDFTKVKSVVLDGGKYSDTAALSSDFAKAIQDKRKIFKFPLTEGYRKVTNWAMEAGDIIFSRGAYARALAGYLQANGVKSGDLSSVDTALMDDARAYAAKEAQEQTFRDTNTLSRCISRAGRKRDTPKAIKIVSEGIMPFRKTPANVLIRAEEYSPLGIVNSIVTSIKALGKDSEVTGAQVINSWSKSLTGTGIFLLGMLFSNLGWITGGPDEDDAKDDFETMSGWQNYALVFGDYNISIDWLSPAAMPLLMGAEFMEQIQDNGYQTKDLEKALLSIADPMIEMSMLQGVNDILENIQYADSALGQLAVNAVVSYFTQVLTNTLLGQFERTFEDSRMTTYVDKDSDVPDWLQRALGKASAKIPLWDYHQVPYINAWGEEEENPNVVANAAYNLLSPSYIDKGADDEVTRELNRLHDESGLSAYPSTPDKTLSYTDTDGKRHSDYALSADEWTELAKKQGRTQRELVEEIIDSSMYKDLTDEYRAAAIKYAYKYARETARLEVIDDYKAFQNNSWMKDISGNEVDSILMKVMVQQIVDESGSKKTYEKVEAITDSGLSNSQETDAILMTVSDSLAQRYENIMDMGYSNDEFATAYRIYKENSGKSKKADTVKEFREEFGISKKAAEALYEAYRKDLE